MIHFNFGLHDLSYAFEGGINRDAAGRYAGPANGGHRKVPPELYEQNLRRIVARLKVTGPKLVWATTTPAPADFHAYVKGDDVPYNEIVARVMRDEGVAVDELNAFARTHLKELRYLYHFCRSERVEETGQFRRRENSFRVCANN